MTRRVLGLVGVGVALAIACGGRIGDDDAVDGGPMAGGGGTGATGIGGSGRVGAIGGSTCRTAEGVRLCGGPNAECSWLDTDTCPGGCVRPYDRDLGGDALAGVCFSDLPDNGSRPCLACEDGEVCVERAP